VRKSVVVCFLILAAFSFRSAWSSSYQFQCGNCCCIREAKAELNLGIRTDDFRWKFTDNNVKSVLSNVNTLASVLGNDISNLIQGLDTTPVGCLLNSAFNFTNNYESHWRKLRMANIGLEARIDTDCCFYGRVKGNYGWVCDGQYEPQGAFKYNSEFFNETLADYGLSTPACKRAKGDVWDISGGIGYNFRYCCDTFQIAPLVGWYYNNVHFHTDNYKNFTVLSGDINQNLRIDNVGELPDLGFFAADGRSRARHNASWTGPWIGFDTSYNWDCRLTLLASFQYNYVRQTGSGKIYTSNTYTISDTVPSEFIDFDALSEDSIGIKYSVENRFKSRVNMRGIFIGGGFNYEINDCWYTGFHIDYWNLRKSQSGDLKLSSDGTLLVAGIIGDNTPRTYTDRQHKCLSFMKWNSLRFNVVIGANF
jgi:hypothetical protein